MRLSRVYSCCLQCGVLRGYESATIGISFAPLKQGAHNARAALLLLPLDAVTDPALQAAPSTAQPRSMAAYAEAAAAKAAAVLDAQGLPAEVPVPQGSPPATATAAGDAPAASGTHSSSAGSKQHGSVAGEKLILTIVGEATQGALCIEPSSVAFGSIKVGYTLTRPLTLINQSTGVLRYSVSIERYEQDEHGSCGSSSSSKSRGVDLSEAACEFSSPTSALSGGQAGSAAAAAVAGGAAGVERDCWVNAPEGMINPRWACSIRMFHIGGSSVLFSAVRVGRKAPQCLGLCAVQSNKILATGLSAGLTGKMLQQPHLAVVLLNHDGIQWHAQLLQPLSEV